MPILESKNLFGNTKQAAASNKQDKPKANFWLNVGLLKKVDDGEVFLSLPIGIPLDTQDRLPETSSNKEFAQMQAARNNIMDQLIAYANTMEPGQDIVIDLQVQLRRVKETQEVSTKVGENKFAMDLGLLESK
jgi:hypothetical protein